MNKTINFIMGLFLLLLGVSCNSSSQNTIAVEKIVEKMTLQEKLAFIGGYNHFNIRGYEHLGIPEVRFADGPVGVRNYGASTAYPASITLAASWDKNLAYKTGEAIAQEARAKNIHVMLGPGMNIYRFPVCGRNFEYLGEDPYLAGKIATSYTLGMQEQGVMATAKHYVANNQEFNRHHCSSDMDERTLHEIYLPAFKATVHEGNVAAVMTSYNLINGIHASEHDHLVNKILKKDWGFDGFVMSDWNSTYDGVACAKGGLDLEMPSGKLMNPDTLNKAITEGIIDVSVIDEKVERILNTYKRFGLFENPDLSKGFVLDKTAVRQTALNAARGGMVLLKNEDKLLPIQSENHKKIAIIGPNGHPGVFGGGGSSMVQPEHPLSLYEAFKQLTGDTINVVFEKGCSTGIELPHGIFESSNLFTIHKGKKITGLQAEYFSNKSLSGKPLQTGTVEKLNLSKFWFTNIGLPENNFSARFNGEFTPEKDGRYCFAISGDDGYRLFIDGEKVIDHWSDHGEEAKKYEVTLKAGKTHRVTVEYYQAGGDAVIRMGVAPVPASINKQDLLTKAINAAKSADMVVLAVGHQPSTESEGFDRTYELPYQQDKLIQVISEVNPNCVVVLNAGGNVAMEHWIHKVKGLLYAWYPGQEGALAAAEILLGKVNPSGKLPASFEQKLQDNPVYNSYWDSDNDQKVFYSEGIFMGYRYFDQSKIKPRYPFGFGLSYTQFELSNLQIKKTDDKVKVSVTVTNTGKMAGAEVVQVYVADKASTLPRPEKELKAFDKIFLQQGESKTLEMTLNKDAFSFYHPDFHKWVMEPGEFEIRVGNSSANIVQTTKLTIDKMN